MATASMKIHKRRSRRRIAAVNFLSNISLDGTHKDTKYAMFNRKHHRLKDEVFNGECNSYNHELNGECNVEESDENSPNEGTKLLLSKQPVSQHVVSVQVEPRVPFNNSTDQNNKKPFPNNSSGRWRASSYSAEKSSVRRKLMHHFSETSQSLDTPVEKIGERSSRRSSSVSGGSSSDSASKENNKNIKFLSPDEKRRIKNERLMIVSRRKAPFVICSTVPYNRKTHFGKSDIYHEEVHKVRHSSGSKSVSSQEGLLFLGLHAISRVEDGQDISYSELLVPSKYRPVIKRVLSERGPINTELSVHSRELFRSHSHDPNLPTHRPIPSVLPGLEKVQEETGEIYDPALLDDPELHSGSYKTLLTFPSYMTSVLEYAKPSTLKKELNETFKEKFPNIQLTLTKLRSLKKELRHMAHVKCSIDLWIVAQSYVFFERLILKLLVNKTNRKLCAGACLILSAKLNDVKGADLTKLIQQIEEAFRLHRKELLTFEFACLVALEFTLHTPDSVIYPHYQRLVYIS